MHSPQETLKFASIFLRSVKASSFDIGMLSSLRSVPEVIKYANENFKKIGSGTSRLVYELPSKQALKVARPGAESPGIAQNKAEKDMAEHFGSAGLDCYAKVYLHHPEYIWIISELVKPVRGIDELASKFGVKPDVFFFLFAPPKFAKKPRAHYGIIPQTLLKLKELVDSGILGRDVMKSDSWGINAQGKPVLLDYGMNRDVYDTFYSPKSTFQFPDDEEEDDEEEDQIGETEKVASSKVPARTGRTRLASPLYAKMLPITYF